MNRRPSGYEPDQSTGSTPPPDDDPTLHPLRIRGHIRNNLLNETTNISPQCCVHPLRPQPTWVASESWPGRTRGWDRRQAGELNRAIDRAHNPKVAGSNPAPATKKTLGITTDTKGLLARCAWIATSVAPPRTAWRTASTIRARIDESPGRSRAGVHSSVRRCCP